MASTSLLPFCYHRGGRSISAPGRAGVIRTADLDQWNHSGLNKPRRLVHPPWDRRSRRRSPTRSAWRVGLLVGRSGPRCADIIHLSASLEPFRRDLSSAGTALSHPLSEASSRAASGSSESQACKRAASRRGNRQDLCPFYNILQERGWFRILVIEPVTSVRLVVLHLAAGESSMLKFVVVGAASLALVGSAVAADLPRPQPVVQNAPIGKYPVGKYPVGKTPVGKYPTPVVTKG